LVPPGDENSYVVEVDPHQFPGRVTPINTEKAFGQALGKIFEDLGPETQEKFFSARSKAGSKKELLLMYRGFVDPSEFKVSEEPLFSTHQAQDAAYRLQTSAKKWKKAMMEALDSESYMTREEQQWVQHLVQLTRWRKEPQQCCTCPSMVSYLIKWL